MGRGLTRFTAQAHWEHMQPNRVNLLGNASGLSSLVF
jgi:hypothetical protein